MFLNLIKKLTMKKLTENRLELLLGGISTAGCYGLGLAYILATPLTGWIPFTSAWKECWNG